MGFIEVAQAEEIPAGKMKPFRLGGKEILIVNLDGQYYAMNQRCTHRRGDLAHGKLSGGVITCPQHGSRFEVATGRCLSGPQIGPTKLSTKDETVYPVKVEGGKVWVEIDQ